MQGSGGISFWLLGFLQDHFQKPEDLASINSLTDRLKHQFGDHEIELLHLQRKLSLAVSSWISKSYDVGRILSGIESSHRGTFRGLPARSLYLSLDDMELLDRMRKSYFWSYPCLLMRFVASSQSETALHLETLVGDLEDAALAMLKQVQGRINSNTG